MINSTIYAYPNRITEAREIRNLNMTQLADRIGVTRQAISRYELGLARPSMAVIHKMAECLNFPESFFYKPSPESTDKGTLFYRTFKTSEASERKMIERKCDWVAEAYSFIARRVKMPPLNLPPIEFFLAKDELTDDDIEEIAHITREYWGLGEGPIGNLAYLMEKNGIAISGSEISSEKTDACSRIQDGVPIVFYNKNLRFACRIRFSLAHELGHILMHKHITDTDLRDPKILESVEHQANRFASAFLMSRDTFISDVHSFALSFLVTLKEKWRVSIAAIIVRCKDLMLIDQNTYNALWRQLSYKRWRKVEPLDDTIPIESPKLLKAALEFLFDKKKINRQEILSEFSWSIDDASDIFCISKSFFCDRSDFSTNLKLL